ncbi:MAG: DNA-processing protein DprA [Treponema sp.]|nr:DNA-processing protein DprA [Treponema sp.]
MDERGLLDLIIARLPGISFREKIALCESLRGEQDFIQKSRPDIEAIIGRSLAEWWDIDAIRLQAEQDAKMARLRGINWVSWQSPAYPPLLREIYDPPVLLFFRGCLPNPEMPLAAIVGTRRPSPQAAAQAFDIAKGLARNGISVVSGLALGIDAMAHRGNLEGGVPAVAVLGSGVDAVYPASNRGLARRILETGGIILSEYPPGTGPRKWNFPARNRIISGLSRGVLIVEAPQKSGALITGRFALDQNRELWVASSGCTAHAASALFDRRGTMQLAEDGAGIIYSASDILGAWNMNVTSAHDIVLNNKADRASALAHSLGITLE